MALDEISHQHRPTPTPDPQTPDPQAPDPEPAPAASSPGSPPPPRGSVVRRLAVLGDSTAVGLGDPLPDGTWRGVGPLIADAFGVGGEDYLNTAFTGARVRCVRTVQLPTALAHTPDIAVVIVGMNDTLRSDFDPAALAADLDETVAALHAVGALVVSMRFHDHGRVFRMPGPLRRAHAARVDALNRVIDTVAARHDAPCVDLDRVPGAYDLRSWSVDRLHPSERGHRLLARGVTNAVAGCGYAATAPVSLTCAGGAEPGTLDHLGWLLGRGVPWLWRRGRDLVPYAAGVVLRSVLRRERDAGGRQVHADTRDAGPGDGGDLRGATAV